MKGNSLTLAPPPNINQSTQFVCKEKWESGLSSPLFCRHIERRLELKSTSDDLQVNRLNFTKKQYYE